MLQKENGFARSVDVARKLNVTKPSVSRAMSILKAGGYIEYSGGSALRLTEKGEAKAEEVYGRHVMLTHFLEEITSVPPDQAEENACRIEHDIDKDVADGIRLWMEKHQDDNE